MDEIVRILVYDDLIKHTVSRHHNVHIFVEAFLNRSEDSLHETFPAVLPFVNKFLTPALLAYNDYTTRRDIFYEPGKFSRFRHRNTDIENKLNDIFGILELLAPLPRSNGQCLAAKSRTLKNLLHKKIQQFSRTNTLHNHSFWNLCCIYYGIETRKFTKLIPSACTEFYLVPYTRERALKTEVFLRNCLERFGKKYERGNAVVQKTPPEGTPVTIPPAQFARNLDARPEVIESLAKDPLLYSMGIESCEQLIYFDPDRVRFYFLPKIVSETLEILNIYKNFFNILRSGEYDDNFISEMLMPQMQFFISNVHIFLRGLYDEIGRLTENGHHILNLINMFKANKRDQLIGNRGGNMWQTHFQPGIYKTPGHLFY